MVGNESSRHLAYKSRIANLLRRAGFVVWGDHNDEMTWPHPSLKEFKYHTDIFALGETRKIVVEILGYKGHNSGRAIHRDQDRAIHIQGLIKGLEWFEFHFFQLKEMDDATIEKELKLG